MSLHSRLLKGLHFQIKRADRNIPEAFQVNWFKASLGPSVKTRIKHWFVRTEATWLAATSREKTGGRGSLCLKPAANPFWALVETPRRGHSLPSPLTWRCHIMGHNPGHLWAALISASLLCRHGAETQ